IAFFFPRMVGSMSERLPKTGSLGIVLMGGVGLGIAGAVGVPTIGKIADRFVAESLPPAETVALLENVQAQFPTYLLQAASAPDPSARGSSPADVSAALEATGAALDAYNQDGEIGDLTANALRAVTATQLPGEPLVGQAAAILQPAEADGGQTSLRYAAPMAIVLVVVFGLMYVQDRRRGGYRAVRLQRTEELGAV